MRIMLLVFLLASAGCLESTADHGPASPRASDGEPAENETQRPVSAWSQTYPLEFTMAASGEVPQEGQNCVAGEYEGLDGFWANATWSPDVDLRLLIWTDFGGYVAADKTGSSPLMLQLPEDIVGDTHVTVALMAPEMGTAPAIEADLELAARVLAVPSPGLAACST